jgi:hypothetical protein
VAESVVGLLVSSYKAIRYTIGSRPPRSAAKKQKTSVNGESSAQYNRSTASCRPTLATLALRPGKILFVTSWHLSAEATLVSLG